MADHHKPSRRWNESDELDVFEAARYFSGYNDNFTLGGGGREERQGYLRPGRASIDLPSLKYHHYHQQHHQYNNLNEQRRHQHHQQQQPPQQKIIKDKKYKQPSSPGGKLAHFLNSLFNQAINSKKKKSSKTSSQSIKDEDESPSGRRRRRRSISHYFRSTNTNVDAKSLYSSSSFGFRSPPPSYNLNTPTKSFRSFSDHKEVLAKLCNKHNGNGNGNGNPKKENIEQIRDEKFKSKNGLVDKTKNFTHGYQEMKKEIKKFHEELDDGAESDSSSDLFELQIDYGLGFCSSGLPVYETTNMDSIKRPSAI